MREKRRKEKTARTIVLVQTQVVHLISRSRILELTASCRKPKCKRFHHFLLFALSFLRIPARPDHRDFLFIEKNMEKNRYGICYVDKCFRLIDASRFPSHAVTQHASKDQPDLIRGLTRRKQIHLKFVGKILFILAASAFAKISSRSSEYFRLSRENFTKTSWLSFVYHKDMPIS